MILFSIGIVVTNEQLERIMESIDLNKCDEIIRNQIYYIRISVRLRYSCNGGDFRYSTD